MNLHRISGMILLLLVPTAAVADEPLPAGAKMKFLVPGAAPGNRPWCVAFSPDGKTLAVGASDKQIHLFDVETGRHLRCFGSHLDYVWTIAFSPDGKWIASGGRADFPVRIWSLDGVEQKPCEGEHQGGITKIKFFKDGKRLIMSGGSWDPTLRVWDFPNRKQLVDMKGHTDYIDAMDLASNERIAVTASRDGTWRLWDVRNGRQVGQGPIQGEWVKDLALAKDSRSFVMCADSRFVIYEIASRDIRMEFAEDFGAVAYSQDGVLMAAGGAALSLRESATGAELWRVENLGSVGAGNCALAFSPDGNMVAVSGASGLVYIWQRPRLWQMDTYTIKLSAVERLEAWEELAWSRAKESFRAMQRLRRDSAAVEEFLAARLKPAAEPDRKQIARWIDDLGSQKYAEREEASRHLADVGEAAGDALSLAWYGNLSLEARNRVRRLLERLDAGPSPETLQTLRAIEVLERRGKPEAIPILKRLAAGAPGFAATIDAQETLERMQKRK
ncbi:MAG TPA: WD40 repeat domain-containing protein [Gemmataceae bacterium]|nr:WD40 repeat domain-containing protein [Gemmataceae bacterium]